MLSNFFEKVEGRMFLGRYFAGVHMNAVFAFMMAVGLFVLVSGKVWFTSGSGRNTQIYIWLLFPALCLMLRCMFDRKASCADRYYLPWFAFVGWVALSVFWGPHTTADALNLAKRGLFLILFLLSIHFLLRLNATALRRALILAVLIVAVGALATLVYQFFWLDKPLGYRMFRLDRLGIGEFANYRFPVAAGIFHGALAVWAFGLAVDRDTRLRPAILWFLVFVTLAIFTFFTYARGAWIGMACGVTVAVLLQSTRRAYWALGAGVVFVIAVSIIWSDYLMNELFKRQLSGRGPIWEYYFSVMPGHWLFGYGLGTPFEYRWSDGKNVSPHAHSLYLQQIYDSGLIAVVLLATGVVSLLLKVWSLRDNYWVRLALPALIFALIAMLTDVERIYTRPGDYWTVVWLPVAILLAVPGKAKNLRSDPVVNKDV